MVRRQFDPDGDPGPPIDPTDQHILIVYLFPALGDSLLLAPVVQALLARGAKVDLLLRESAARIWAHLTLPVRIRTIGEDELRTPSTLEVDYDIAIDLTRRFDSDGRAWVAATNAPIRLGWIGDDEQNPPLGLTFGTPDFRVASERHWSRYQVLPLRCLGVTEPDYALEWKVSAAAHDTAAAMFDRSPRIVVVPGAREAKKIFKPTAYGHAVRRAQEEVGGSVVVVGGPNERAMLDEVATLAGARVYAERDLGVLIALVQHADLVLTNDTGPMHIAFLLGVPTVAVFAQMPPLVWGPPDRNGPTIVIRVDDAMLGYSAEDCGEALANAVLHRLAASAVG